MQVILVGHDFGGTCISYATELFPAKVSKAVFLAAAMLTSGQSALDIFSDKVGFLTDWFENGCSMQRELILSFERDLSLPCKLLKNIL